MSLCMNCNKILNVKNQLIDNILKNNKISKIERGIIINYINNKIKALHDDHYFCDDCINHLYYVANIQDTMITKCPICPRSIFIDRRNK